MGSIMTPEQEICWLAGFFEGEGCVSAGIYHRGTNYYHRMVKFSITQKDDTQFCLLQARRILVENEISINSVGIYRNKRSSTHVLAIGKYEFVERASLLLWPYLSPSRRGKIQEAFLIYCEDFDVKYKSLKIWSPICDMSLDK